MAEIEDLQQKYRDLSLRANQLTHDLDVKEAELERREAELKRKSDLCTMYMHILDERGKQLDDMTDGYEADEAKIAALNATVDTLAVRIAELKNGKD